MFKQEQSKKMNFDTMIAIGGFIAAFGTIIAIIGTKLKNDKASRDSNTQKIEIATLKEQNANLQKSVSGYATGGNSSLDIMVVTLGNNKFKLIATLNGKYPLSDVEMWYVDMVGWKKMSDSEAAKYYDDSKEKSFIRLGNFNDGSPGREFAIFELQKDKEVDLQFHFITTNKSSPIANIKGRWVDGQWLIGTEGIRMDKDEPYYNFNYEVAPKRSFEELKKDFF